MNGWLASTYLALFLCFENQWGQEVLWKGLSGAHDHNVAKAAGHPPTKNSPDDHPGIPAKHLTLRSLPPPPRNGKNGLEVLQFMKHI